MDTASTTKSQSAEFRGRVYDSITETIGATPLVRIHRMAKQAGVKADILAKCEFFNPLASVKDRIGVSMIDAAEAAGRIKPGTVLVEPTSGNTGIALAFVCAARGYRLILTMPDSMSVERRKMLLLLGAELELTPAAQGMKGAIGKAEEIARSLPDAFIPQQFQNPANPEIHRRTTAEEIWNDTDGKVDVVVSGIGTGGTLTGVGVGAEAAQARAQDGRGRARGQRGAVGRPAGPAPDPGLGAGFIPRHPRHQADRRGRPHRQRHRDARGARGGEARSARGGHLVGRGACRRARDRRTARHGRQDDRRRCCPTTPSAICRRRCSKGCEARVELSEDAISPLRPPSDPGRGRRGGAGAAAAVAGAGGRRRRARLAAAALSGGGRGRARSASSTTTGSTSPICSARSSMRPRASGHPRSRARARRSPRSIPMCGSKSHPLRLDAENAAALVARLRPRRRRQRQFRDALSAERSLLSPRKAAGRRGAVAVRGPALDLQGRISAPGTLLPLPVPRAAAARSGAALRGGRHPRRRRRRARARLQAVEVLKELLGLGDSLDGTLLHLRRIARPFPFDPDRQGPGMPDLQRAHRGFVALSGL